MSYDYNTVAAWMVERAPDEVYAALVRLGRENSVLWAAFKAADMAMRQSASVEAAVEFGFRREEVKRVTGWPSKAKP